MSNILFAFCIVYKFLFVCLGKCKSNINQIQIKFCFFFRNLEMNDVVFKISDQMLSPWTKEEGIHAINIHIWKLKTPQNSGVPSNNGPMEER